MKKHTENNFTGDLKGFPVEILNWIEDEQELQGLARDAGKVDSYILSGFTWGYTKDGHDFCHEVLIERKFHLFLARYDKNMSLSDIKYVWKTIVDDLDIDDKDEIKEIIINIESNDADFTVGNYRFIHKDSIDEIQQEELSFDPFILGSFSSYFIADNTDLSIGIVEALQSAEKHDAIGQHIIDNNYVKDIQFEYSRLDGYGNHFNHYNGNEVEIYDYYAFRIN